ncbi:hypothetical protein CALCODRAFT_235975 [Calocera cornea HHB12733]|uniref:Uncharacterized protein n=1 Tax=Calocera cornea HHB12733 TaxID=1353952 RepID=A0A165GV27_9BASI|nr:hypothetical protein CALCODRAFT_235975 [Calocera cornea HHB12733]
MLATRHHWSLHPNPCGAGEPSLRTPPWAAGRVVRSVLHEPCPTFQPSSWDAIGPSGKRPQNFPWPSLVLRTPGSRLPALGCASIVCGSPVLSVESASKVEDTPFQTHMWLSSSLHRQPLAHK